MISSGAFVQDRDRQLFKLLHTWQQRAGEFNRRLDITELRTFINPTVAELIAYQNLHETSGFAVTLEALKQLAEVLITAYSKESGITKDSVLFQS